MRPANPPVGTGKKINIVIEEENGGHGFNVYMTGDKENISGPPIDLDKLTPAEFWGLSSIK